MKLNILRGKILQLLHELYPDGIEYTSLVGIYYQYEKIDNIRKAIQYLADRELVTKIESPHPFKEGKIQCFFKIAPGGIDLLEGSINPIAGVCLVPEAENG